MVDLVGVLNDVLGDAVKPQPSSMSFIYVHLYIIYIAYK